MSTFRRFIVHIKSDFQFQNASPNYLDSGLEAQK